MKFTIDVRRPADCSDEEIRAFCKHVNQGGEVADLSPEWVRHHGLKLVFVRIGNTLAAVGALKKPDPDYQRNCFLKAGVPELSASFSAELGWIYCDAAHRGGMSDRILNALFGMPEDATSAYATVRTDNAAMLKPLNKIAFTSVGRAYPSTEHPGAQIQLLVRKAEEGKTQHEVGGSGSRSQVNDALRSPILLLENNISSCVKLIAPERECALLVLKEKLGGVPFELVNEVLFGLRADPVDRRLIVPISNLEYIWVCAFKQWVVYDEMRLAQGRGDEIINLLGNSRLCAAAELFEWSKRNLHESGKWPWPAHLPKPEAKPCPGSDVAVANELGLGAIAFMLLHELGHLELQHVISAGVYSQQQEKQADRFAAEWIFGAENLDGARLRKRGLCVASALLCLQSLETRTIFRINRGHPPAHERIDACMKIAGLLEDETIAAFNVAGLQDLFAETIEVDRDGPNFSDIRDSMLVDIARRSSD